ncbi:carbon-nitrogen hydrolase family protein [Sulfitobacter sp. F26204]|uniref:carbon-nitrogen hydrolase family protein n=1 Tax=Sulfitobacter sp. F26204 TaxID=2996014 RepID=UPI00225DF13F|nr:carbon-nitrogen hydrolase family protein [Sulfitobacter sp. F26204]MCX7560646.1 carbon-nitrogen hydrolase family protein [Sulfitobacter sp. F26204]
MKIACMQIRPLSSDVTGNLERLETFATRAGATGCDILVTPEMYVTGYNIGATEVRRLAQPDDGFIADQVSRIATRTGIAILYGYPEICAKTDAVFNSVQLISASGTRLGGYRKTHLYGAVDAQQFRAGDTRSALLKMNGWKIALAICYDIEFPELARAYARDGADIILTPTANMAPYDGVAKRLVPARAEENGIFVAYANYIGREGGFDYNGLSCICGPDGTDRARGGDEEVLIQAVLERSEIELNRKNAPYLMNIRSEIYVEKRAEASQHD